MGKYKQWLHHQEVGARLRDEIAAHEAERERVLKLAPNRTAALPDISNPIIAALLGQGLLAQAPAQPDSKAASNGASATTSRVEATQEVVVEARVVSEATTVETQIVQAEQVVIQSEQQEEAASRKSATQAAKGAPIAAPEEVKAPKGSTGKQKAVAAAPAKQPEQRVEPSAEPAAAAPAATAPAPQPEPADPLLDALLARAENEPGDPLEALTALANKGANLTRGEPPAPLAAAPATPSSQAAPGESALNTLLIQSKGTTNPQISSAEPAPAAAASVAGQGSTGQASQANAASSAPAAGEKGRVDTDELIAARPAEGYTEPRLAVPWWLRSVELNQEGQESEKPPSAAEETEAQQRLSVSLPFENEEDMQLHESVERWWQRWRQQS